MGGVKLARACPAGYYVGASSCRYYKLRPRSACRVMCRLVAIQREWNRRIKNLSSRNLRVRLVVTCGCD